MNQSDDAVVPDAQALSARADRLTLVGLAPIETDAPDSAAVSAMPPLASDAEKHLSQPPPSPEVDDPEWLDLSTRWMITPGAKVAQPIVDDNEVTEHVQWADRLAVPVAPRAAPLPAAAPPPPPPLAAAHPSRRLTIPYGRPQPWTAGSSVGAQAPYELPNRYTLGERRAELPSGPTGATPFYVAKRGPAPTRRLRAPRRRPSDLSAELWRSISDTWPATLGKWAIALVLFHYTGLAVPLLAHFGYAPTQIAAASGRSEATASSTAATLAAPNVIGQRASSALDEEPLPAVPPRRVALQRDVSSTTEVVRYVHVKPAYKPKPAAPTQPKSPAAARGIGAVVPTSSQVMPSFAAQQLMAAGLESDEAAGEAFLRINSRPWSQIFVDGTHVGHTPKLDLRVRAGAHRIRFVNAELGVSKTIELRAAAGATVSHFEFLEE